MAVDEPFRPRSRPEQDHNQKDLKDFQENLEKIRQQTEEDDEFVSPMPESAMQIKGNMHPDFIKAMQQMRNGGQSNEPATGFGQIKKEETVNRGNRPQAPKNLGDVKSTENEHLKEILINLKNNNSNYQELELPSKGRFYDGTNGPLNGILSIRPMTGEEEQILATPQFVRRGQAINMIFQKCLKEGNIFRPENLLTIDRTYLLIYLRIISYGSKYDVELKCPDCERKFGTTIELDRIFVEPCPDDYGPILQDVLPNSNLPFAYRLSTGKDEQDISDYRDRKNRQFGDSVADQTLTYRTAVLLHDIDGVDGKQDLQAILKNLPINDLSHIRNCLNEPPFGSNTNIEITCAGCLHDFEVELPLEANFFFPRRRKKA